jgi:hypothetical protein
VVTRRKGVRAPLTHKYQVWFKTHQRCPFGGVVFMMFFGVIWEGSLGVSGCEMWAGKGRPVLEWRLCDLPTY